MANFATRSSVDSARRAWALRVLRIGGVIQACFAAFWLVRGSLAIGGLGGTALAAALLAAALAALVYGLWATAGLTPRPRGSDAARFERGVTIASVIQLVASFAAPFIVITLGHPDLVVPSIAITIGPLLLYLGYRLSIPRYRLAGWALTLSPVVCALVISGSALSAIVGLGAGASSSPPRLPASENWLLTLPCMMLGGSNVTRRRSAVAHRRDFGEKVSPLRNTIVNDSSAPAWFSRGLLRQPDGLVRG